MVLKGVLKEIDKGSRRAWGGYGDPRLANPLFLKGLNILYVKVASESLLRKRSSLIRCYIGGLKGGL